MSRNEGSESDDDPLDCFLVPARCGLCRFPFEVGDTVVTGSLSSFSQQLQDPLDPI